MFMLTIIGGATTKITLNECRQITRVQFSTRIFQTLRHPRKQRIRAAAAFWVCFDNCDVLLEQSRNIIMGNQK